MIPAARSLYSFLGVHSFLIGMFPFYIPVYLYNTGFSLASICGFISFTGMGFLFSLYLWDRISKKICLHFLIIFSFLSEMALLTLFFLEKDPGFIFISGFFNGIFNCSFWIIQRFLFLETITPQNSGKKFGNFQIFVLVILKAGIFAGGVLLEKSGFGSVYIFSFAIAGTASVFFWLKRPGMALNKKIISAPPLGIKFVVRYKDCFHSRIIFAADGIFLYLESYFWMISLFLIVRQSYWKLGVLVIFLMILFGGIFVMIKNRIDQMPARKMYIAAVCLYSISWLLRSILSQKFDTGPELFLLAVITFCTSIFRLTFNKHFFDIAKSVKSHEYIFIKSYFSQFFLAVSALAGSGFLFIVQGRLVEQLSRIYLITAFTSFIYLFYKTKGE